LGLTVKNKVSQVKKFRGEFGLNQTLRTVGLQKSTWYYYQKQKVDLEKKYLFLKEDLRQAVKSNPAYGYRKLKVELNEVYGHLLNHKLLKKLLKVWDLALPRVIVKPKPNRIIKLIQSVGTKANLLKAIKKQGVYPFQVLITDFTWVYYHPGEEKLALIGYEDYQSKIVLGYAIGVSQNTRLALKAWKKTKKELRKRKVKTEKVIIHQDQGSPFTSHEYINQLVIKDQAMLSYAAKGKPGDNAAKESFIGHLKTENKSLFLEAKTARELKAIVKNRIIYYNTKRRHESLGYLSPENYLKNQRSRGIKT
jgi:putative transposase